MRQLIKKTIYTWIWSSFLWFANVQSFDAWIWKVDPAIEWSQETADKAIQSIVANLITFLYLVAVLYGLWGWFNILTAWGDEEKVKKWKSILIQALMWIVVIWLASSIVWWLLTSILV